MRAVAHPIHELQNFEIEPVFRHMILDEHEPPADAARLGKKSLDPESVVQNIHEHANIK